MNPNYRQPYQGMQHQGPPPASPAGQMVPPGRPPSKKRVLKLRVMPRVRLLTIDMLVMRPAVQRPPFSGDANRPPFLQQQRPVLQQMRPGNAADGGLTQQMGGLAIARPDVSTMQRPYDQQNAAVHRQQSGTFQQQPQQPSRPPAATQMPPMQFQQRPAGPQQLSYAQAPQQPGYSQPVASQGIRPQPPQTGYPQQPGFNQGIQQPGFNQGIQQPGHPQGAPQKQGYIPPPGGSGRVNPPAGPNRPFPQFGAPGPQDPVKTRIDPDLIPSPDILQMEDQNHYLNSPYMTMSRLVPPLSSSRFKVFDNGNFPFLSLYASLSKSIALLGNSSPKFIRSTLYTIPATEELLNTSFLPFGLVIQPMCDPDHTDTPIPLADCGSVGPVRCDRCKAYINPFFIFSQGGRKIICNLCRFESDGKHF